MRFLSLFAFAIIALSVFQPQISHAKDSKVCLLALGKAPFVGKPLSWTDRQLERAYEIMVVGSMNVSRTKAQGQNLFSTPNAKNNNNKRVSQIAERNFRKAVAFVLENFKDLEVNLETASEINKMLTKDLVDNESRGNHKYRSRGVHPEQTEFKHGDPDKFYDWFGSKEAEKLRKKDPIGFAELVHNAIGSYDSFPDGNGRTARLMADLVLIKAGYSPAFYTEQRDYFDRGNQLSGVSRKQRVKYFREIVERGMKTIRGKVEIVIHTIKTPGSSLTLALG